jgi:dolichyl-phosphate beta-glucosyltransferase
MYNEGDICVSCAEKLHGEMAGLSEKYGWDYEIIFCDDGSSDGCREKIERLATEKISVVGYGENRGKGSAVREAVKNTTGDIVVYTDCDLAYGTAVIEKAACELMRCKADMLLGSRNMGNDGYEGYSKRRKIASKIYIKVIAVFAGFRLTDSQCGFKAFKGESARKIFSLCTINGFSFDLEVIKIAQKLKMRLVEMPVKIVNHRESKVNIISDALRMLRDIRVIKKRVKDLKV